jgi:hypothetical protein
MQHNEFRAKKGVNFVKFWLTEARLFAFSNKSSNFECSTANFELKRGFVFVNFVKFWLIEGY